MTDYSFSRYENVLAEAASTIANHGFTDGQYGECGYGDDWNALVTVSSVILMNCGEDELREQFYQEYGELEILVWIRETNDGFVKVIRYAVENIPHGREVSDSLEAEFIKAADDYYEEDASADC
jgi:hypothetical protein